MTAICPHCTSALSTYKTIVDSEPTNIEVLVCAHCDKVLGVVGPAWDEGRRIDVNKVADLLDVAASTDDEGEARTVFSVAIKEISSEIRVLDGGGGGGVFERLLRALFERQRERKQREDQAEGRGPSHPV